MQLRIIVLGAIWSLSGALLWAADPIRRAQTLPDTTPWDLAALSTVPAHTWLEDDGIRSLTYEGEPYQGKPTRVFAYYASPQTLGQTVKAGTRFPTVVLVHGGGGTAFPNWVKLWAQRGYAAIAMDLAGCGPGKQRLPNGGPGQGHDKKFGTIDLPKTEQWTYHAVANVIRAHSLVRSFPEVDSKRTALTGISWGGYLTCIVSGLDDRFQAAVPVYGCGFLHENSVWLSDFAKMTRAQREKWVRLWDPSQYVGSAKMPMLFVNGGKDFAYPPDSHAKTFALVKAPKVLHFVPDLRHGHIFDKPKVIEAFIAGHLGHGEVEALPSVSGVRESQGEIVATVEAPGGVVEAWLHFTTDELADSPRTRVWKTTAASGGVNGWRAKAPPREATAWFLTVRDTGGRTVSSPLVFPDPPPVLDTFRIRRGDLDVVLRSNVTSPRNLSGVTSLKNTRHAPDFDAFDPDTVGASAGLNFEHIISGHKSPHNKFTPRSGTYRLEKLSASSARLVRRSEDSPWKIASQFTYRVVEPHYIDFAFQCTPRDASLFGSRGYALLFFAHYMNDVIDPAIHFRGQGSADTEETWIRAEAPQGPPDWRGGGNYRSLAAAPLGYDEDVEFRLNTWSYDWPRITQPYYYGRAAHGMTLILMFDQLWSPREEMRFSLYKFKLPKHPRPAWDFQYVIRQVKANERYGFKGRLVWKKFVAPEDVDLEYLKWDQRKRAR